DKVDVHFTSAAGDVAVCAKGRGLDFDEDLAKKVLSEHDGGFCHAYLHTGSVSSFDQNSSKLIVLIPCELTATDKKIIRGIAVIVLTGK
ncbi:MAG: hypothetical protein IJB85_09995, partial [Clostridia bacterium]|nr:hypothetical protein [Clostridia bacterium]